jgi:polysaccharide biosynthesis/export protein
VTSAERTWYVRDVRLGTLSAVAVLVLGATACRSTPAYDYAKEPDPRTAEYRIGPLDQLSIVVWKNKEMSGEVTVRPDGIVTLPLIGDVRASDRTPSDLQKEITKRYASFLREEELVVSVAVASVNSYAFTVSGNVERPGVYTTKAYVTAVQAVAMAGGPNRFASNSVFVVRGTPPRRIPIDLQRATSGEQPEANIPLLRGDTLVVP